MTNSADDEVAGRPSRGRMRSWIERLWMLAGLFAFAGCATGRNEGRSPIGMQHEMGRYRTPDVVLNGVDPAPARTIHDCGQRMVIYAVNLQPGDCDTLCAIPPFQCVPCSVAFGRAVDYFQNQFRCDHADCRKRVGEIIWMGWSCHKDTSPPLETFTCAMEVEVWCEPEL